MLKQGIGFVLLCLAGHAFSADIVVTTTDDITRDDKECSLREAVEYINQGKPETGLNGCGGKDATDNIILSNKIYSLNSQIRISKPIVFRTRNESNFPDDQPGSKNSTIEMKGNDRIFHIERIAPTTAEQNTNVQIGVAMYEVTLKGCSAEECKEKGGLILNYERLLIDKGQLINGKAKFGGAIYNANNTFTVNSTTVPTQAFTSIDNSLIKNNQAEQGAVIYTESPNFSISNSVIRDNGTKNDAGFLIYNQTALTETQTANLTTSLTTGLVNNTIFNNKGYVIKIMDGMLFVNNTMILNQKGLVFNAPFKKAYVANSIIANNSNQDCNIETPIDPINMSNNLYGAGCTGFASQALGQTKLIASNDLTEGKCDQNSDGILCPFKVFGTYALGYFKPRLLPSYTQITDSPIVNRGPLNQSNYIACPAKDQRGVTRVQSYELCDRGAIELNVGQTIAQRLGQDIRYGQTARMSLLDNIGDGELIPASQCQSLFGNAPNNKPWQPGCMKIVQTNTPSKGTTTISEDGEVVYVPNGNWHGADEFNILVVVSTRRFNDPNNAYIEIPTRIAQDPPNTFTDYKVKTSGGSLGLFGIVGLLGLLILRRKNKTVGAL